MAVHWGVSTGSVASAAVGDVFVSRLNGTQQRCTAAGPPPTWVTMQPSETRGDIIPTGGAIAEHLAKKTDNNPYDTEWVEAAEGMVWDEHFTNQQSWTCLHNLRFEFVSVTAIKDDGTIMIPDIAFSTDLACVLTFVEPVSGTAIIRR